MSTPTTLVADRYRLIKLLGAGGMGVVWQAWDERLHRPVALKMLRSQPELTDQEREVTTNRAMREARITAGLHHPHAVTVFDVVEHEGQPCLVMELLESTPLSVLLREHGTLTPGETARIGAQVSSALAAAHKMRIVHRDVKPGNILITEDGSAMISDFGISHALGDTTITATGMIHGTPAYLAPEVARGQPSGFASDVFSLGSTLYAMLEGAPPFGAENNAIALLHKVARGDYAAPKHAGVLAPLLRDMLSADPKRRPDMKSVAARLAVVNKGAEATDEAEAPAGSTAFDVATLPLAGAAATVGATAETAQLDEVTEETAQLDEVTEETAQVDEVTAETLPDGDRAGSEAPTVTAPTVAVPTVATPTVEAPRVAAEAAVAPAVEGSPTAATEPLQPAPRLAPAPARPPGGPPVGARGQDPPTTRRRRGVVAGIALLLGILVLGAGFLSGILRLNADDSASPGAGDRPTTADTPAAETPATRETPSESPGEESPVDTPSPEAPPPPATTPTTPPEGQDPPPAGQERVVETITNYYALLPGNLDSAWPMMTADYQENHAGGRGGYESFWNEITDVQVADVSAPQPDQAQATLTYSFTDGRVIQEVTAYRLVEEEGMMKIAATTVLSSTQL